MTFRPSTGYTGGQLGEGIFFVLQDRELCMHFLHEVMKMHTPLASVRNIGKESVHQQAFASTHTAMEIEPFGWRSPPQGFHERLLPIGLEIEQFPVQLFQTFNRVQLRGVGHEARFAQ